MLLALTLVLSSTPVSEWQYRWGDAMTAAWAPIRLSAHPKRGEGRVVWERAQVDTTGLRSPALKLDAVIGQFELFADGKQVFVHPAEGIEAKGQHGMPYYLVDLPPGTSSVALRIMTGYPLAGIQGVPKVGERAELLEEIVQEDLPETAIGLMLLVFAAFAAVLMRRQRGLVMYLASAGVYILYYTQLKQHWLPLTPGLWFFLWLVSLAVIPAAFLRFNRDVLHTLPRWLPGLQRAHELFAVGFSAVMLLLWGALELWGPRAEGLGSLLLFLLGVVLRLMMVVSSVLALRHVLKCAREPGPDRELSRTLLFGFAVLAVALVANVAASLGLTPSMRGTGVAPGFFVLAVSLMVIAARSWSRTQAELSERAKEKEAMLRDLHDGIGGVTTNIRMLAELGKRDPAKAVEALGQISELSSEGLAELRAFIQTLDESEAAVTWPVLVSELRRFGGQLIEAQDKRFELEAKIQSEGRPSSALCLTVLRIFREALTNVVKHAGASRVDVEVSVEAERFALTIRDDGKGGGAGGGIDSGRGVGNMKARAKELGGELTLALGDGARLSLVVPLPQKSPAGRAGAQA